MAMWNPWRGCKKCSDGCLYAINQLQKNRTTSYDYETNNRRSGPKGRGFESRHFDTMNSLAITLWLRAFFFFGAGRHGHPFALSG